MGLPEEHHIPVISINPLVDILMERGITEINRAAFTEVAPEERKKFYDENFMDEVSEAFKEFGFRYVSLDLSGYKKGNMNKE